MLPLFHAPLFQLSITLYMVHTATYIVTAGSLMLAIGFKLRRILLAQLNSTVTTTHDKASLKGPLLKVRVYASLSSLPANVCSVRRCT